MKARTNKLIVLLIATIASVGVAIAQDCYFDADSPDDGDDLIANTKFSLGGASCNAFEIRVGKVGVPESEEQPVLIPRSAVYSWQGCRFTNVINQNDIDLYVQDQVNETGQVRIYGYCGYVELDGPAPDPDAPFVSVGEPAVLDLLVEVEADID